MSFEGYYQVICRSGHASTRSLWEEVDSTTDCDFCLDKLVWRNLVDETNGSHDGEERIDGYVELQIVKETISETHKCSCGKDVYHIVSENTMPIYKIPKDKGNTL